MLWLPGSTQLKTMARVQRRRQRRRVARLLLFLFLFFGLGAASAPPQSALPVQVDAVTAAHRFDLVDWESWAVTGEIGRRWNPPALPAGETEQRALVQTYLDQAQRLDTLQYDLDRRLAARSARRAVPDSLTIPSLNQTLDALKTAQTELTPPVETILARQVETILREQGFTLAGQVFPPVAFRLTDPPTGLVLSPRDRIANEQFINLQPGLDTRQREAIETALDQRGDVSSYVTDIGGLGSYPTMIINQGDLIYLTDTIAHEWAHNYLFTFLTNIAWAPQTDPKLMTLNETAASLVGQEISRQVISRFYPEWVDRLPPLDSTGQPQSRQLSPFDQAMRRIRRQVDQLLAEGKIEQAEAYMETERLKLIQQGYTLRKLNQAYFAFHGSYTLSPASVDPTGQQIRQLRAASPSLKAFLDRVGRLNSSEDYRRWLAENNLQP